VLLGGALLGLLWFQGTGGHIVELAAPPPAELRVVDPWAESRRSAEILRLQEGPPPSAVAAPRETHRPAASAAALRVVDGDTFWYQGEKIRVADIDTPEVQGRCPYETRLAARATRRTGELLREGPFELEAIGGRDEDRYGRKLRVVTRGGRSLGDQLVAEGLARTWTGRREPWCA